MAAKLYELRVSRIGREVQDATFVTALDLTDADATRDLLDRHVVGVALRVGARRSEAHEFSVDVRDVDREGRGYGAPLFRWGVPVDPDVMP